MTSPVGKAVGVLVVSLALGGCGSARDSYRVGQDWQRAECARLPGASERERCLESSERSYEDFRRAREEALPDAGANGVR